MDIHIYICISPPTLLNPKPLQYIPGLAEKDASDTAMSAPDLGKIGLCRAYMRLHRAFSWDYAGLHGIYRELCRDYIGLRDITQQRIKWNGIMHGFTGLGVPKN